MINPIAIAINRGTNRKQVPNIIGSSNSNMKKIIKSVAQIFDFFLASILTNKINNLCYKLFFHCFH